MSIPRLVTMTLACLALLAPAASAATGPYAGVVRQGETDWHSYDNNPTNSPCIQMATTYTVTLAYAPTSDVLTLSVAGKTASGSGAGISFQAGVCAAFPIAVTGTQVADLAAYEVTVTGGVLGGAGSIVAWG